MDSTEPSPNGISASNLYRLSSLLADTGYARVALDTVQAFEAEVEQFPWCFAGMLESVVWGRCGAKNVVVVGNEQNGQSVVERLRGGVGVARTVVGLGAGRGAWIRERNGLLAEMDLGKDGVWVCEGGVCRRGL